jgi:hypothetical protein
MARSQSSLSERLAAKHRAGRMRASVGVHLGQPAHAANSADLVRSRIVELRAEIASFYEQGHGAERLSEARTGGPLEFARTIELISRYLPPAPLDVLDVGGGPDTYAVWLRDSGDRVQLVDPVALHVDQARVRSLCPVLVCMSNTTDGRLTPCGN